MRLAELKVLRDNAAWENELGLGEADAKSLRSAVERAYEEKYLDQHYQSAHDKMRGWEQGRVSLAYAYNAAIDAAPKRVKDAIDRAYADKDGNVRRDEVLADLFGKKGDKAFRDSLKTLEGRTWYNRVWKAVKEAWRGIMRKMGFDVDSVSMRKLDRLRPEETVDWLVKQMIEGKRLAKPEAEPRPGGEGGIAESRRAAPEDPIASNIRERLKYGENYAPDDAHHIAYSSSRDEIALFHDKGDGEYDIIERVKNTPENHARFKSKIAHLRSDGSGETVAGRIERNRDSYRTGGFYIDDSANGRAADRIGDLAVRQQGAGRAENPRQGEGDSGGVNASPRPDGAATARASDDIRESRALPPPPSVPATRGAGATSPRIDVDKKETFLEKVQRRMQDYRAVIKKTEERLGVAKDKSVYHALDLAFGKNRDQSHRLAKTVVEPMLKSLHDAGIEVGRWFDESGGSEIGLDDFLYARHALERNRYVSSGMSDAKARAIIDAFDALPMEKRAAIRAAADKVVAVNKATLLRRVESGRLSEAEAKRMLARYKHYVPLRTDMEAHGDDLFNTGTGGWRKHEFHRALGRESEADSPLVFSLMQAQDAITGANKNEARQRLWDMVEAHPELGRVRRMDALTKRWSYTDGRLEWVADERYNERDRDDVVMVKRNGELYAIELAGRLGKRIASAVTSRDLAAFPDSGILSAVPWATRKMAAMRTQLVPTFILRNLKADHLEVFLNGIGDFGAGGAAKFLGSVEKTFASKETHSALHQYFKTGRVDVSTETGRLFDEYTRVGSLIGGGTRQGYADTATELSDVISDLQRGKMNPKRWAKATADAISTLNEHSETGTRFSVYATLRRMGWSPEEAASYSRDLTTNFNRKGEWTPVTNSLFMFSNAAIQGLARASKSMNPKMSPHAYQSMMAIAAVGAAQAMWRHFLGSDEERRMKGEGDPFFDTDYDKANYIRFGGKGYGANLKVRYPWAAVNFAAQKLTEYALGDCTKKELFEGLGEHVAVAMLQEPFGHGGTMAQTVAPSLLVPVVQALEGKDFRGEDLYAKKFDDAKPDSENGKSSTAAPYQMVARALNKATGGDKHHSGYIDAAPETVKLVAETLGGGVWTDATRLYTLFDRAAKSISEGRNAFEVKDVPFVGDLVHHHRGPEAKYYEAIKAYAQDKNEFKDSDGARRKEMRKSKPYLATGKGTVDALIDRVKELQRYERGEVKVNGKWTTRRTPLSAAQTEAYRKRRLEFQAKVLKILEAR